MGLLLLLLLLFFQQSDQASDDEIDQLEEASVLKDISHMPARVKCAVLGWRTLNEMFKDGK